MHYILKQYHYLSHPNYTMANHYGSPTKSNHFFSSGHLTPMISCTNLEELSPFSHLCDENLRSAEQFYYCCRRCFNVLLSITSSRCLQVPVTCLWNHLWDLRGKLGQSCNCRKYVRSIATFPKFGMASWTCCENNLYGCSNDKLL
jgi:hypothetical protein